MAREVGIPNELLKTILALMSAGDGDDMATLWGNARIAFEQAEVAARADGYRAGIEAAARLLESDEQPTHYPVPEYKQAARLIRALAPAAKKEEL